MPNDNVAEFLQNLPAITEGYRPENIFNADETALYFQQLPERTLERGHSGASGSKRSKDRLTLMLCCSAAGEKLPPLVIGKYQNPRCFRGKDRKFLPCNYDASKNAWMTASIFNSWLTDLNRKMSVQKRNILLFLDNACSHRADGTYSNIRLAFLPPNCTAVLQPIDQSIIWSFKCKFRRLLLDYVIEGVDSERQGALAHKIDIYRAMIFIKLAWGELHPDTVIKSFKKVGFQTANTNDPSPEDDVEIDPEFQQYVQIDEQLLDEELIELNVDLDEVSGNLLSLINSVF